MLTDKFNDVIGVDVCFTERVQSMDAIVTVNVKFFIHFVTVSELAS